MSRLSGLLGFRPPGTKRRIALDLRRHDDDASLGKSPTIEDVEWLARRAGFGALLCLNTEGEPGQILSPNVEASWAHTFEMQHERVSIDIDSLRSEYVDEFLEALREIAKPVYVHSLLGRRAAAMMTVHSALEREIPGHAALRKAEAQGTDGTLERLLTFTASEVERRARQVTSTPAPGRARGSEGENGSPASPAGAVHGAS